MLPFPHRLLFRRSSLSTFHFIHGVGNKKHCFTQCISWESSFSPQPAEITLACVLIKRNCASVSCSTPATVTCLRIISSTMSILQFLGVPATGHMLDMQRWLAPPLWMLPSWKMPLSIPSWLDTNTFQTSSLTWCSPCTRRITRFCSGTMTLDRRLLQVLNVSQKLPGWDNVRVFGLS